MPKFTSKQIARFKAIAKSKKEAKARKFAQAQKANELVPEYFEEALWTASEAMEYIAKHEGGQTSLAYKLLQDFVNDTQDFQESLKKFELTMKKGQK